MVTAPVTLHFYGTVIVPFLSRVQTNIRKQIVNKYYNQVKVRLNNTHNGNSRDNTHLVERTINIVLEI